MTNTVLFPVSLGGDGNTYNDGSVGPNNLAAGGHRTSFVPCLSNTVIMAQTSVTQATAAQASATAAAASATAAAVAVGTTGTSVTSNTVGTGSKTFTTQTGKAFTVAMFVTIGSTGTTANTMYGNITAYNSGTGVLTVNVTQTTGSGTNTDWAIALSGAARQYPSPTGNAGKFLTTPDGVTESWATVYVPGLGGTTLTASVTLTSASPASMTVTPTAPGLYATLPDATTMTKSDSAYAIYNASDYDYGVKDNAGTQLGWVKPKTGALIGLADNSIAAGIWTPVGLDKIGITAQLSTTGISGASSASALVRIPVDANRTAFMFGGTGLYVVIYDASTQLWGAPVAISVSIQAFRFYGVLSGANQLLCAYLDPSATAKLLMVTATLSGTGIVLNTPVSTTLTSMGTSQIVFDMITMGSSYIVRYGTNSTTAGIRAITVSGTVPTVGAHTALTGFVGPMYVVGSVLRVFGWDAGANGYAAPFTLSAGTTLTAGTPATIAMTCAPKAFVNGNGNIMFISGTNKAGVVKLTGTTEVINTTASATIDSTGLNDFIQVGNNTAGILISNTAVPFLLTDTAGVASTTNGATPTFASTLTGIAWINVVASIARCIITTTSNIYYITFDMTSGTPTVVLEQTLLFLSGSLPIPMYSDVYTTRSPYMLVNGSSARLFPYQAANAVQDLTFNSTLMARRNPVDIIGGAKAANGATAKDSWFHGPGSVSGTSIENIQHVELAA